MFSLQIILYVGMPSVPDILQSVLISDFGNIDYSVITKVHLVLGKKKRKLLNQNCSVRTAHESSSSCTYSKHQKSR